jgi:hypothetical protein
MYRGSDGMLIIEIMGNIFFGSFLVCLIALFIVVIIQIAKDG